MSIPQFETPEETLMNAVDAYAAQKILQISYTQKQVSYLDHVSEFHKLFKHPILDKPQILDAKIAQLRIDLLKKNNLCLQEILH